MPKKTKSIINPVKAGEPVKRKFQASFNGFFLESRSGLSHHRAGPIKLPGKELAVFVELILNAGKLVTKEELVQNVWLGFPASDSSIARCISSIKSQLKKASPGADGLIQMVYGQGYKFVGEVTSSASFLCEESISTLINTSSDFILFKDGHGRWLEANHVTIQAFDLEQINWQGKTDLELADLLPEPYRAVLDSCTCSDAAAWDAKLPSKLLETVHMPDGSNRYFDVIKTPLFHVDGRRHLLVVLGHDVTELLNSMEQQRLAEQALEKSHEAVMITDLNGNIISINKAFTTITGYTNEEVLGKQPRMLTSERRDPDFYQTIWQQIASEGAWRGEITDTHKSGDLINIWLDISSVHDRNGQLSNYIAIFSELTTGNSLEKRFEFLAFHDPLTQLPNRLLLHDRFKQALANASRVGAMVAVLFLDLDKFKQVNDNLGHNAGDQLLKLVGQRLQQAVRDVDTISRIGGDEFVVLLTELHTTDTAALIAEKILAALRESFVVGKQHLSTSTSIGIAMYPHDGHELDALLHIADEAMYQAKNSGRNTFRFYTEPLTTQATDEHTEQFKSVDRIAQQE